MVDSPLGHQNEVIDSGLMALGFREILELLDSPNVSDDLLIAAFEKSEMLDQPLEREHVQSKVLAIIAEKIFDVVPEADRPDGYFLDMQIFNLVEQTCARVGYKPLGFDYSQLTPEFWGTLHFHNKNALARVAEIQARFSRIVSVEARTSDTVRLFHQPDHNIGLITVIDIRPFGEEGIQPLAEKGDFFAHGSEIEPLMMDDVNLAVGAVSQASREVVQAQRKAEEALRLLQEKRRVLDEKEATLAQKQADWKVSR